ncbi:AAA family ATPase [Kribbella sp. NPDC023855]|uniref:AAA family ATPase n=1 Tax=Kribbella sp. NPDC023855 TaxID=3154698 RepID=UPI0033D8D68A
MADTRPAGEGSERSGEPKVPAQDQPVSELARLIAQSDAKGKGFWRRRKRKAPSTTTPEPAAAAPTVDPPAAPAPAGEPAEEKVDGQPSASVESADASAEGEAVESPTAEVTTAATDGEQVATGAPSAEKPVAAEASSSDEKAVVAGESSDDEAPATEAAGEESSAAEVAASSEAAAETIAKEPSDEEPTPAVAEGAAGGELSAEMVTAAEMAGGDVPAGAEALEEESRPKVGVVYEPVESAEGFPLEYGEIIIGLPKQPGGDDDDPVDLTQAAEAEAAAVAAEEAANNNDDPEATAAPTTVDPTAPKNNAAAKDQDPATEEGAPAEAETPTSSADVTTDPNADEATDDPPATNATAAASTETTPAADTTADASTEATPTADATDDASAEDEASAEDSNPEDTNADSANAEGAGAERTAVDAEAQDASAGQGADDASVVPVPAIAGVAAIGGDDGSSSEGEEPAAESNGDTEPDADDADARADADDASDTSAVDEGAVGAEDSQADASAEGSGAGAEAGDASAAAAASAEGSQAEAGAEGSPVGVEAGDAAAAARDDAEDADAEADASVVPAAAIAGIAGMGGDGDGSAGAGEAAVEASGGSEGEGDAGRDDAAGDAAEVDGDGDAVSGGDAVGGSRGGEDAGSGAGDESGAVGAGAGAGKSVEDAATEQAAMALITALMKLRGALAASQLPLDVVGADEARQQQKSMLDQLDDYILPRLVQLEAPVLAVVGGSTGAGKSTLVNSLIGQVVSEPGVLRPTTRSPVLIHHPADAEWFVGDRVLPGMARSSGDRPGGTEDPGQIRLVAADTIPPGLAILDAPDIDSVVEANRELATQLLAAADLWLFVTTAARYADAVPWEFLQSASDRSTAVAVVLDRAPADTIDDITGHLAQMLLERGLGDSPLFSIKETVVDSNGMLASEVVASIKDWLIDLAADSEARSAVVRRTLQGAVTAMTKKTPAFAKAVRAQADTVVELRSTAETAYERAVKDIALAIQDGTMLRGEVLARWQEFVGTGELLKGLQTNVGRLRDKVRTAVVGKPAPTRDLKDAVESGLESLMREHAEAAAERAEEAWQSTAPGRQLLAAGDRDMGRMSKEFPAEAARAVREWQGHVLELVRQEGADKRSTARILAYGVNGLGLALMMVIFASTAGITGAEFGVGAGTAVVAQKLLEAVFGDQAVRSLAAKARDDLDARVHTLMDAEFARYLAVLDQHPVDPDAPRQLTEAARAVEDCT